jgi:hypothetical protein
MMVGQIWEFEIDPGRCSEFETVAGQRALPLVRGRMGCSAVFILRGASVGAYGIFTFWLSRKAMTMALASPDWGEVRTELARFGVDFDLEHARTFESVAHFLAGENPEAPSAVSPRP